MTNDTKLEELEAALIAAKTAAKAARMAAYFAKEAAYFDLSRSTHAYNATTSVWENKEADYDAWQAAKKVYKAAYQKALKAVNDTSGDVYSFDSVKNDEEQDEEQTQEGNN